MKLLVETTEDFDVLYEENDAGVKNMYIHGKFMQAERVNRNGRVYPKAIMEREVNRYVKEQVSQNTAAGELGHPCFWERTEILTTQNGWKFIKDIADDEEIFTLNKSTGQIEKQTITRKVINVHKGKMFKFTNRTIETCVTPDHRFVLVNRHGEYEVYTAQQIFDGFEERKFSHHYIPKTAQFKGTDNGTFVIPGMTLVDSRNSYLKDDIAIDTTVFMAFMGYYLSEGCTTRRSNRENGYRIAIFQNAGENADLIRETLKKFPAAIHWNERETAGKIVWENCDRRLGEYLHKLGNCYSKYIPQEIKEYGGDSLRHLLDAFIVGDGRGQLDKKRTKCDVFSTSYKLAEDLSEIAFKCGYATRQYKQEEFQDTIIENRVIKGSNKNTLHFVQILSSKGNYIDPRFMQIEEINWDDKVYCVQVPNETLMAKDGEYSFWSANCGPQMNLDRISHRITSLKMDGNDAVGKALILNTEAGKTAKALIEGGLRIGVSSRALGSIKETTHPQGAGTVKVVQPDFKLFAIDIVADPSAPDAYVDPLMENTEWVCEDGVWKPKSNDTADPSVPTLNSRQTRDAYYKLFEEITNS